MRLNAELLSLTDSQIHKAFEERNAHLLEKETIFVLQNVAFNLTEAYSDIIQSVKPIRVQIRKELDFIFTEKYLSSLMKMLLLSETMFHKQMDFAELKLSFDSWFYEVTAEGFLLYDYRPEHLLSITGAAEALGVTRQMIYKYMERGLEAVGVKGGQKIPTFLIEAWKNPSNAFKMQWIYQVKQARSLTTEQKLERINKQIGEFEIKFGGTFHKLYGQLSDQEIDVMPEAVDISDWKKLEQEKERILERHWGMQN